MAGIELSKNRELTFIVPGADSKGVRRIARKVAEDVKKTTGLEASFAEGITACSQAVIAVTADTEDSAEIAGILEKKIPELKELKGKWEAYGFYLVERPLPEIDRGIVIYGSDKLGTIYGLFHLSELLGVTAMKFWGDQEAETYERILLSTEASDEKDGQRLLEKEMHAVVNNGNSKEPSVKYRGFFINDEWPCYGNWTFSHFGGFTAEMYDHVFEYLLRMKGNYLWPAMWTSSFLLDGPDMASMELADEYGIFIGMSHHEPCTRSSEEWDIVKGKDTPYGEDWSYVSNKEGLLNYWEDGLKRSRGHNAFPTIGMRGERDSKMLGDDAAISENVRLLKEIITNQRKLIKKHLQTDEKEIPQLFAVYKEVEDYYFGDGNTEGLRDFEELDGVTLLLCEDNFGNMRALPKKEERNRRGGFGMYYHLDYHGGPCSYEWVSSQPLTKIWEQMTMAYEYGIRELWIVNAGDLKFQEYPLNYFMDLAYDFDTWGSKAMNACRIYTKRWVKNQFGTYTSEEEQKKIGAVVEEYIRLNHLRRPESCNDRVYHPAHEKEVERMLKRCKNLEKTNEEVLELLKARGKADAYYSMIYYPAQASANLLEMHLYAGLNHLYAKQGKAAANLMGELLDACVERDEKLAADMAAFKDSKWAGMEKAFHIGFTNWNSEDWRYPVRHVVRLWENKRLVVSRVDEVQHYTNQYFQIPLMIEDFLDYGTKSVELFIANGGQGTVEWQIEGTCPWLSFSAAEGSTEIQDRLVISVKEAELPLNQQQECTFNIRSGEEFVPVCVKAVRKDRIEIPKGTFLPRRGVYAIDAVNYAKAGESVFEGEHAGFEKLYDFGKHESGIKVFPVTAAFKETEQAPYAEYPVWVEQEGSFRIDLHTSPANPLIYGDILQVGLSCNGETPEKLLITGTDYKGGDNDCAQWEAAVLAQEHVCSASCKLKAGLNTIRIYALEAGITFEKLVIYLADMQKKESYLGPQESLKIQ